MTLRERLLAPRDAAPLIWFRVVFGLLMAFECARYLAFGWVREYWVTPQFHFKFYGFEWVHAWPGDGMIVHFVVLIALALAVASGALYRVTAPLFTLAFAYVFLLDQAAYLNHFYAAALFAFLLALAPANTTSSTAPAWAIWSLRAQIGVMYIFGGIAKLNPDWLAGQPLTMWLQASPHLPELFKGTAGLYLSWAGAAFDLLIVPALLWSRTRNAAFAVAVCFHVMNAWMFHIGIFPWLSIAATALYLPADHWLFRPVRTRTVGEPTSQPTPKLLFPLLFIWGASQLLLPLRPYMSATNPHWTEDGHRFSWHMKLRTKYATGTFWLENQDGTRERVDARDFLTDRQLDKMLSRPDMILQFAHLLRDKHPDKKVFGLVHASLNGRSPSPLTNVAVDLAAEPRTLWSPSWVLPFPNTPIQPVTPHVEELE